MLIKKLLLPILLSMSVLAHATPPDKLDQGEYVLLDTQARPTSTEMRFFLEGTQWMMDGRKNGGEWQAVCRGNGECRLVPSSTKQIKQWRQLLPTSLQNHPLNCINNKALAFCRLSDPQDPNRRLYWWVALVTQEPVMLPLNRTR